MTKRSLFLGSLLLSAIAMAAIAAEPQAATQRLQNGESVPIAQILAEWQQTHADTPRFVCVCTQATCHQTGTWPSQELAVGEVVPALGRTRRQQAERSGFACAPVTTKTAQALVD